MGNISKVKILRKGLGLNIQTFLFLMCLFLALLDSFLIGQVDETNTSKQLKLIYGFDNRRTSIAEQNTLVYGGYVGLGYNDQVRVKLGVSGTPFEVGRTTNELGLQQRNRFYFFNVGMEYDFFIQNRFRLTAYGQFGAGQNFFRYFNPNSPNNDEIRGDDLFLPLELGLHANYDALKWLRLKAGGGWRFSLYQPTDYLSGYYIKLGASVNLPLFLKAVKKLRNEWIVQ